MCLKRLLKNGGLFVLLLVLTLYMVLKDNQIGELVSAFESAEKKYLLAGVLAMVIFICGEALNIARGLRVFHYRITPVHALKYALNGFFFSAVTPSASGGQPMQLYSMHQDNIQVSHGTLALLFELLSSEIVTAFLAVFGYLFQREGYCIEYGKHEGVYNCWSSCQYHHDDFAGLCNLFKKSHNNLMWFRGKIS